MTYKNYLKKSTKNIYIFFFFIYPQNYKLLPNMYVPKNGTKQRKTSPYRSMLS